MSLQSKRKKYPGDTPNSDFASATPFDDARMIDVRYTGDMTPDGSAMNEDRFQAVGIRYPYSPCHSTTMSSDSNCNASSDDEDERINLADFDEHEAETKRQEYADDMFELEQHFASAREILLGEKLASLDDNLIALTEERLPEYVQACKRFENEMAAQLENAEAWKEMHMENLKINAECDKAVIDLTLAEERELLLSSMREEFISKMSTISAERELLGVKRAKLCDPTIGDLVRATIEAQTLLEGKKISGSARRNKIFPDKSNNAKVESSASLKQSRRRPKSPQNDDAESSPSRNKIRAVQKEENTHHYSSRCKPTVVTGPYIVYLLRDQDIMDDWYEITHALRQVDRGTVVNVNGNGNSLISKRVTARISSDNKLYYDSSVFSIGDDISVTRPGSKYAEESQLWKISNGEITLRNPDTAQQNKIPLSALQTGRWILKKVES